MKRHLYVLVLFLFCSITLQAADRTLDVVPQPQNVHWRNDRYRLSGVSFSIRNYCRTSEQVDIAVKEFVEVLRSAGSIPALPGKSSVNTIFIGIPTNSNEFRRLCTLRHILPDTTLGNEGYRLFVGSGQIIIAANHQKGLFYGLQTLKQMVRGKSDSYLPGVEIADWPAFRYRGVMDDISRGPVPTLEYMKFQVRRLAEMKVNMFMHYVEVAVKTKQHPEFAPVDGSLTIDEWKELARYAELYNITLVGSFQSFGHFNAILQTPQYAYLGECGTLLSPLLPESYRFLQDIYAEMIPAFHAPFFNVACDETFDLGKGASKKLVDSLGYAEVYVRHILALHGIVEQLGTHMMMWGDVLLAYPELLKRLPKDIVVAPWTYDNLESYDAFIDPITKAGFQFFAVPGVLNSNKLFPEYTQVCGNIAGWARATKKSNALGTMTTVWDERGMPLFTNDWYGVAFAADKSWNPESSDSLNFDKRFCVGIYGTHDSNLTSALHVLGKLSEYEPTDGMNDNVFYTRILPDSGRTLEVSPKDWQKIVLDVQTTDSLLQATVLHTYPEDVQSVSFTAKLYSVLARERLDILRASEYSLRADTMVRTNPSEAKKCLKEAIDLLEALAEQEKILESTYASLWSRENRSYALAQFTEPYRKKVDALTAVVRRLEVSVQKIDTATAVSTTAEIGLAVIPFTGKYFTEWLMTNPYSAVDTAATSHVDYLGAMGGEVHAVPKVTQEFVFDSTTYRWTRKKSDSGGKMNVADLYTQRTKTSVIYAFATLEVPNDTITRALASGEGGLQIWVNGTEALNHVPNNSGDTETESFFLHLRKGQNTIMVKLFLNHGNGSFMFRLPDVEVRNHKNRYEIVRKKS
jgi:hypothetical protein